MKKFVENGTAGIVLLLAGAALLLAGLLTGQAKDVLLKAAQVCLECIGVG